MYPLSSFTDGTNIYLLIHLHHDFAIVISPAVAFLPPIINGGYNRFFEHAKIFSSIYTTIPRSTRSSRQQASE
ncbi:hypothetical protein ACHAXM_007765, partial [Skeletonema potamos]